MIKTCSNSGLHLETLVGLSTQGHQPTSKLQAVTESTEGLEARQSKPYVQKRGSSGYKPQLFEKSHTMSEPLKKIVLSPIVTSEI